MGWISDFISDPIGTLGETGQGAIDTVGEVGREIDQTVRDVLPGGWTTAALITAGYVYYPEISAWVNASGTSAVPASDVAAADAAAGVSDAAGWDAATSGQYGGPATGGTAGKALTAGDVINAVRGGLLVNAITGDPLGLNETGSNSVADTGFDIVPVPSEWKSPEYTYTPVQNVTFEDLFPGVSLRGTQWSGMQRANPNMTFNEMFASGRQTPMGSPVDINQIVGSIIGQSAKS